MVSGDNGSMQRLDLPSNILLPCISSHGLEAGPHAYGPQQPHLRALLIDFQKKRTDSRNIIK